MKQYLLLRNNKETGPHSIEDLKALGLKKTDLIWIEGASSQWAYASEINGLNDFIIPEVYTAPVQPMISQKQKAEPAPSFKPKVFVSLPAAEKRAVTIAKEAELETLYEEPLSAIKERYVNRTEKGKFQFGKQFERSNGLYIMVLLCLLIISAIIVKNIVENNEGQQEKQAVAETLPIVALPEEKPAAETNFYKNAISREVADPATTAAKPVKKTLKLKDIRKQVSVTANKYKVGFLGGVDDLELNVRNNSPVELDKVNVRVQFLKPNGETVRTEEYSVYSIAPGSTKILVVPPSKRGVKVKYTIAGIESRQPKSTQI